MNKPNASIRIKVDPTNPGQFFACCGLLELADRLWGGAEGWFEGVVFQIACKGNLVETLKALVVEPPVSLQRLENGLIVKPLLAPLVLSLNGMKTSNMTLDSWVTVGIEKGKVVSMANPPWNFWSGQQTPQRIWSNLRVVFRNQLPSLKLNTVDLFSQRVLLSGRFGFDPGPAWNALDVGFSPNEQGIDVESSAAVELLAAVGIQRFRPSLSADRQSFVYQTWGTRLAPSVAAAAACNAIRVPPASRFTARVVRRGSYAALSYSLPYRGETHD